MIEKTLLKISGIIAFILGILACITIVGAIVGVPLIIGGKKFMDLSNSSDSEIMSNKDNILVWSIVFLLLCLPAGIIGIVFYVQMDHGSSNINYNYSTSSSTEKELERLKKLYDDNLISKEEYDTKRKKILDL